MTLLPMTLLLVSATAWAAPSGDTTASDTCPTSLASFYERLSRCGASASSPCPPECLQAFVDAQSNVQLRAGLGQIAFDRTEIANAPDYARVLTESELCFQEMTPEARSAARAFDARRCERIAVEDYQEAFRRQLESSKTVETSSPAATARPRRSIATTTTPSVVAIIVAIIGAAFVIG